ncbi:HAUS augmin-like complex subunit 4 [Patella vulgata]|uniref:HAUS augmin-like complex subunit 4 n=1 Tax=Patella vulgata TaxID=6465 RepID=UPI00217FB37F|nr:HAUS augmin-like complex subunit 4 [Patella vulgata]
MSGVGENEKQCSREAGRLNEVLPVNLQPDDVEKYPEFIKLLTILTKYINPQCITVETEKDLKQSKEILHHAKHTWLLNQVLYHEVKELILEYKIKGQDVSLCSDDKKFVEILHKCLNYKEIVHYLDFSPDPSVKATLLGLTNEDVHRHNPYKKHITSLQLRLIPEIEDRLRKKCEDLVHYEDPNSYSEGSRLTLAKASQLPATVEILKKKLEDEEKLLKQDRIRREKQFWVYYQSLVDALFLLEKLIQDYRLQEQTESDRITSKWLKARCDTMSLKIRLIQLQVLCDTYSSETVKALGIIKKHVEETTDIAEKDLSRISQALTAYDSVGMGFENLVDEYSKLRSELENKRWAMTELQHSVN